MIHNYNQPKKKLENQKKKKDLPNICLKSCANY